MSTGALSSASWAALTLCCCACGLTTPSPASASAWNRPAGQGFIIFDYTLDAGTNYFDGAGHLVPAQSYSKSELSAYAEYGITDKLMLIARPSLDDVHVGVPDAGAYQGLGSSAVGAQWQALVFGPAVLAVQGSFSLPGSTSRSNPAVIGNTAREGEFRVLGGYSLPLPFRPFLNLEGSYRVRSSGGASEWHGDATFGFYPIDSLMILCRSFTTVPTGPGTTRLPSSRATRLELSGVYHLTPRWSVQLGIFTTAWGQNALRERGFITGVWWYF